MTSYTRIASGVMPAHVSGDPHVLQIFEYIVPSGSILSNIRLATSASGQLAFSGLIYWDLRINGITKVPVDQLRDQIGSYDSPLSLGTEIVAYGGDILQIVATSVDPVSYKLGALLQFTLFGAN